MVIPHPQGNFFELKQRKDDPAFQVAYMIGQMQHHIVFKQEFKTFKEEIQGIINTQHLHSGVLQVTFFNKDDPVSYTHLRAHETVLDLVCRLLLEKKTETSTSLST